MTEKRSGAECTERDLGVESVPYFTIREAAEYLGLPAGKVLDLCRSGEFGYSRLMWADAERRTVWVIPKADVEMYHRQMQQKDKQKNDAE